MPWGESRTITSTGNATPTDYQYTVQRKTSTGLYYYNARWNDPSLGRFVQADTIVPYGGDPISWDRYAYVRNSPIRNIDPSGHYACEDSYYGCRRGADITKIDNSLRYWKWAVQNEYGIKLEDGVDFDETVEVNGKEVTTHYQGGKWDKANAKIITLALGVAKNAGIEVGSTRGTSFRLYYHPDGSGHYSGYTSGDHINFYTLTIIPMMNIYHEYGHLLDSQSGNAYTNATKNGAYYSTKGEYLWGGSGIDIMSSIDLLKLSNGYDPNWPNNEVVAIQHPSSDPSEQWADIYANYVIDNINNQDLVNWVQSR